MHLPQTWLQRLQAPKRTAINCFLIFHILAIACWCLPIDLPPLPSFRALIRPYFLWTGLFQSWDMFAPTPWVSNSYVEALIIYKDGSRTTWSFPRLEQLSQTDRVFKERYRKFSENLQLDQNDALWPDVARRIARLTSTPSKPAKTVILVREWSPIVPRPDGAIEPHSWDQHVLYGYGVKPEDLR
jgi:hypothetical protein